MNPKYLGKAALSALLTAAACSGPSIDGEEGRGGAPPGSEQPALLLPFGDSEGSAVAPSDYFDQCAGRVASTEALPLNVFILFDTSCSMSCPPDIAGPGQCCTGGPNARIDPVREAVGEFLRDPDTAGIRAGIGYFGDQPVGLTSCNSDDYSEPAVPFEYLPENSTPIITSLGRQTPLGETPTGSAIRGACQYSRQWRQDHPGNGMALILVTDGMPEAPATFTCNPTVRDAAQAARECLDEGIPTYVVGIGANLDNLHELASSGGTSEAYLVQGTSRVATEVLDALAAIRQSASVPCEFSIPEPPDGSELNPSLVNVTYAGSDGVRTLIPSVTARENCSGNGGWFYNDPSNPSSVVLCQSSCDIVTVGLVASAVRGITGVVQVQFGCRTIVDLR